MAFAHIGSTGSANSKAGNQSSIAINVDTTAEVGNLLILHVAKDNINTTFADHSEFTSVTDSKSNTWTKALERTNAANAKASTVGGIFYSVIDVAALVGATDTITVNFASSNSNDASAAIVEEFTIDGSGVTASGTNQAEADGADLPALTISSLDNIEHLGVYAGAKETTGVAYTAGTGETEFTASPAETTGGGAAGNQSIFGEWNIFTATSNAFDPSDDVDGDCIGLAVTFDEVTTGWGPLLAGQRNHLVR